MVEPMVAEVRSLLYKRAREDFETFLELGFFHLTNNEPLSRAPYLSALAVALEEVEAGVCPRLVVTIPPRYLKSITTTVLYSAWLMGRDPAVKIICASYSHDLAKRHSEDFRKVMASSWYRKVFPKAARSMRRSTETMFVTEQGGRRMATAVGGAVTGFGADYIIIDDLIKAGEARYAETRQKARDFIDHSLLTRFNRKGEGRLISIQQRLHEDDPVDHLLAKAGVRHLNLPAIALKDESIPLKGGAVYRRRIGDVLDPGREPLEVLDRVRDEMGSRAFEAQYQQNPTPRNDDYLKWEKIERYDDRPERPELTEVVVSWDTAMKDGPTNSYSVGTVWGWNVDAWLLLHVERARLPYPELLDRVRLIHAKWRPDLVLIEDTSLGTPLLGELRRDARGYNGRERAHRCQYLAIKPAASKEERLLAGTHLLYTGKVFFPAEAAWLEDYQRELLAFPDAKHNDQVDSTSQFLEWASSTRARARTEGQPPIQRRSAPSRSSHPRHAEPREVNPPPCRRHNREDGGS